MTQGRLVLLGAGGHAKVVAEAARAAGWSVLGFLDPGRTVGERVLDLPVLGAGDEFSQFDDDVAFVPAIGDGRIRWREFQLLRHGVGRIATVVHPAAVVSPSATVGPGSVVMAGAVVQAQTRIGAASIVNTGATVDHDCVVGDGVMIAPGATLCGGVRVGDFSFVAAGAVVIPGVTLGRSVFIGAGTVVVDDVADDCRLASVRRSFPAQ